MPPRTRGVKLLKACKENIDISNKNKVKVTQKSTKPARRPLADKTNSASDENASPEPRKKVLKESTKTTRKVVPKVTKVIEEERPRRNRRLPTRYVENQVLTNLSNSKETSTTPSKPSSKTPIKSAPKVDSPFKTPTNVNDSLVLNREKRVCRLPSKFDDSISPSKFAPIQPCHTSTPLAANPKDQSRNVKKPHNKLPSKTTPSKKVSPLKVSPVKNPKQITPQKTVPDKPAGRKLVQKKINEIVNTVVRQDRNKRLRKIVEYKEATLSPKPSSPVKSKTKSTAAKITSQANSSYRILEEKKSNKGENQDVYEFTFDPSEEPQKKKRKKVTHKKPSKPKQKVFNNNYEKNLARALADLKNAVSKQKQGNAETASDVKPTPSTVIDKPVQTSVAPTGSKSVPIPTSVVISTTADVHQPASNNYSVRNNVSNKNHASIRVEDIAADFAASIDHHDDINYSPVNSPGHHPEESNNTGNVSPVREPIRPDDPLNLRNDLSFFDEQPVASSSMNMSNRNPMSTPWRVEFERLPIKWQSNTYVKPDMTPALESSYVNNFDDSKKKHVYTDLVEQVNETIPDIVEDEAPKLKQTSIISFIKEVVERSANKKRKMGSGTPTKANSLFDATNTSAHDKTQNKQTSGASSNNASSEKETSAEGKKTKKRKNYDDNNPTPVKVARNNDNTLFGFDDSENQEQENISPVKVVNLKKLRNLRSRSNAVLKDLNKQAGPMRAVLPAAMKAKLAPSSDVVEKIYDQMKSAADAPVLLDRQDGGENAVTELPKDVQDDEDSQSIHLFEDVQVVHHLKPTRKSYGKSKKVAFDQPLSDSSDEAPVRNVSSDDDADDLSFHLPEIKPKKAVKKKKSKKQLLSKKEKAEVDAWAACFNSMCEDIEEFDLVVE